MGRDLRFALRMSLETRIPGSVIARVPIRARCVRARGSRGAVMISVVVSTFGDPSWRSRAQRAVDSALHQHVAAEDVHYNHCETLHEARNLGAEQAKGDWLVFLDADDELDYHYIEEMQRVIFDEGHYKKLLVQPHTLGIVGDKVDEFPVLIPRKSLIDGNFLVIGTAVRRDQFLRLGGFRDWPLYEDWDLWIRCAIDGAEVTSSLAIYKVHVNEHSRNQQERNKQVAVYNEIRQEHLATWNQRMKGRRG